MAPQISELDEAATADLAGVRFYFVVDVEVVYKVAKFFEDGLALVEFANHHVMVSHCLRVDPLYFVVLPVGVQLQNLESVEELRCRKEEVFVSACFVLSVLLIPLFVP